METKMSYDRTSLTNDLTEANELAKHLQLSFNRPSANESCLPLAVKIGSLIERALSMAKSMDLESLQTDSSRSGSGSPRNDNSRRALKDQDGRVICKRRKQLPKWTKQVIVNKEGSSEGSLDDGYQWRKYGQKDILGAQHQRGYFRCSHRNTQGCPATKQVQRSDDNPSAFDITYYGAHTCHQSSQQTSMSKEEELQLKQQVCEYKVQQQCQKEQLRLFSFQTGPKVKTENSDSDGCDPSSSFLSSCTKPGDDSCSQSVLDDHFMRNLATELSWSTTSEPCIVSDVSTNPVGIDLQGSVSAFTDTICVTSAAINSLDIDFDLFFESFSPEPGFPYDNNYSP